MKKKIVKNNLFQYILFAVLTSAINVLVYLICYRLIIQNIIISNLVAYIVSITLSFITNKLFVFKNKQSDIFKQVIMFLCVKAFSFFIDSGVLIILKNVFHTNDFWAKIIANASTTISNYSLNKKIVFREK